MNGGGRGNGDGGWGRNRRGKGKGGERETKRNEKHEEKAESEAKTCNYACPGVCRDQREEVVPAGSVRAYINTIQSRDGALTSNTLPSSRHEIPVASPPSTRTKLSEMEPESSSHEAERARRMSE